jgi:hypothetical protein
LKNNNREARIFSALDVDGNVAFLNPEPFEKLDDGAFVCSPG